MAVSGKSLPGIDGSGRGVRSPRRIAAGTFGVRDQGQRGSDFGMVVSQCGAVDGEGAVQAVGGCRRVSGSQAGGAKHAPCHGDVAMPGTKLPLAALDEEIADRLVWAGGRHLIHHADDDGLRVVVRPRELSGQRIEESLLGRIFGRIAAVLAAQTIREHDPQERDPGIARAERLLGFRQGRLARFQRRRGLACRRQRRREAAGQIGDPLAGRSLCGARQAHRARELLSGCGVITPGRQDLRSEPQCRGRGVAIRRCRGDQHS